MLSGMIWFVIITLCCMPWIAWIFMSNRTRVHPPLPPGPLGFPIAGSLAILGSKVQPYFAYLTKTYGPLVSLRIGKRIGIVVAPSMAKEVLKDHDVTFANHVVSAASYEASYGGLSIAWTPYGPKWRMIRKVFVRQMLGSATLNTTYTLRKNEIHQTMSYFQAQAESPVNIGKRMYSMAMSMVTSMIWGGTVKGEERAKLKEGFLVVVKEQTKLAEAPNVSDVFPVLARFDLQGIMKKVRGCRKRLDDIFDEVIDHSRKMEKVEGCQKDLLQVLVMELEDSLSNGDSKSVQFTMEELKALIMDVVAGQSTITNTIEFAMAEIVNKSEVMTRAQRELDTVLRGSNAQLEESHIHQLPYLQAIMKETLRPHPVIPLLIPHYPTQSCVVGGYTIPKDSRVFINVWAIHRDPSLWEDPLEFKPERFLDGKRYDYMGDDLTYFPFGSGRRNCAGIPMAEKTVLYSLASLLHYFDWKLPEGVEKVDLAEKFGPTLKKRTPLLLIPSPRSSNVGYLGSSLASAD